MSFCHGVKYMITHFYSNFLNSKVVFIDYHLKKGLCIKHALTSANYFCTRPSHRNLSENYKFLFFHSTCSSNTKVEVESSFTVVKGFINEEEERSLVKEVEPHLKLLKYEFDHWDNAIHGYKEIEKSKWSSECSPILKKLKETSFRSDMELIPQVHVLDLSPEGHIKPHVDSIRFCGNTISGLCLLSDAVMRLIKEDEKDQIIDVLLSQRGLYIMRDASRYKYTHEILAKELSYFGDEYIERSRRISVICRNVPR